MKRRLEGYPDLYKLSKDLGLIGLPEQEAMYAVLDYILKRLDRLAP